jgi:hypothetical protein
MSNLEHPVTHKYFFTLNPRLESRPVGEVPGGYRVDLFYVESESTVKTDPKHYAAQWLKGTGTKTEKWSYERIKQAREKATAPLGEEFEDRQSKDASRLDWFGVDGKVASGADWLTVREDGVATFDGRITLRADESFLIDAVISGVVDLRGDAPMPEASDKRSTFYEQWLLGTLPPTIPVVLPVKFEAAKTPGNWASDALRKASEGYWKFERLARGQFLAAGSITLQNARCSPISSATLNVYEMRANISPKADAGK